MISAYRNEAQKLHAQGLNPLPIVPGTKRPALRGWQRFCSEPMPIALVKSHTVSATPFGIGLALGYRGLVAVDIDTEAPTHIRAMISALPPIRAAKRGRRGFTAFFQDPTGKVPTARFGIVEVLARGTQSVLPPSIHPHTRQPYLWLDPEALSEFEFAALNQAPRLQNLPALGTDDLGRLRAIAERFSGCTQRTITPLRLSIEVPAALSELEWARHRRYAEKILSQELMILGAMARNSGRNVATFRLVCRVGRWVHHAVIPEDRLAAEILEACERNELVRDDGRQAVLATIASALAKSARDMLPYLGPSHG